MGIPSPDGGSLRDRLRGGGGASILLRVFSKVLALLLAVVLARGLGADGYGVYAYAVAIVTLIAIPAQFGVPQLVIRETAKAAVKREWGVLRGLWIWSNSVVALLSASIAGLAVLLAWYFFDSFERERVVTFLVGLLLVPLISFGNLRGSALYGLRKVIIGQLPEYILRPLIFVALISAVVIIAPNELSPVLAITAHATAAAIAFLAGIILLRRSWPDAMKREKAPPVYRSAAWRRSVIPLGVIAGLQIVTTHIDVLVLGLFAPVEEVGNYRVVAQAAILIAFGLDAVNTVVAPYFARFHQQKKFRELQYVATTSARYSTLIGGIIFLVFIFFGKTLLGQVFGTEFMAGYTTLVILGFGQMINAAVGSVGYLLRMCGYERDVARAVAGSAVLNVALNFLLVPLYGSEGAAAATAVSIALLNVYLATVVKRRLNINCTVFPSAKVSGASPE